MSYEPFLEIPLSDSGPVCARKAHQIEGTAEIGYARTMQNLKFMRGCASMLRVLAPPRIQPYIFLLVDIGRK